MHLTVLHIQMILSPFVVREPCVWVRGFSGGILTTLDSVWSSQGSSFPVRAVPGLQVENHSALPVVMANGDI